MSTLSNTARYYRARFSTANAAFLQDDLEATCSICYDLLDQPDLSRWYRANALLLVAASDQSLRKQEYDNYLQKAVQLVGEMESAEPDDIDPILPQLRQHIESIMAQSSASDSDSELESEAHASTVPSLSQKQSPSPSQSQPLGASQETNDVATPTVGEVQIEPRVLFNSPTALRFAPLSGFEASSPQVPFSTPTKSTKRGHNGDDDGDDDKDQEGSEAEAVAPMPQTPSPSKRSQSPRKRTRYSPEQSQKIVETSATQTPETTEDNYDQGSEIELEVPAAKDSTSE